MIVILCLLVQTCLAITTYSPFSEMDNIEQVFKDQMRSTYETMGVFETWQNRLDIAPENV